MRLWGCSIFALLGVTALHAGAVGSLDVSAEITTTVHTGDTLVYHLFTWNFAKNAARSNLPAFPSDLTFALVTAPVGGAGEFAATLESGDGSVTAAFGNLSFRPGLFASTGYSGDVSTLQGYLHMSPLLSQSLFESGAIAIALENLGPDVEFGISSYTLRQNMFVSLSLGRLSVGALPGWVELEEAQNQKGLSFFGARVTQGDGTEIPEPDSGRLLVGGGAILCGLSVLLRQIGHYGRQNR